MPIVVPGISTGSSNSTASTSPTSLPQDSTEDSASNPATVRRRSASSPVLGDQLRDSEQSEGDGEDTDPVQGSLLRGLPQWLEDFTDKPSGLRSVSIKGHTRKHFS